MDKFVRQCNGTEVHFLIGSGVSCSAGLPSISEITETLTNGGEDQPANAEVAFLRLLGTEVDSVFARMFEDTRLANYEDLFYVASQIGADFWEYENPATMDFVERILKDERFVRVAADEDPDSSTDADVGWLANHSVRFIQTGVQRILEQGSEIADRSALGLFADAAEDPWTGSIDIFSLNHDTVLEQLFFERQIPFEDGLSVREGDLSFWCLPSLDKSLAKVQLLKLHGSVDWWQFGRLVGKARANPYNPYYLRDRHGHRIEPPGEGPVILIGTFNKMLKQAGEGIFLDLLGLYSRRLREASRLVIAGYGFGDKGINSVLGAWLEDRRGKAVWIHPRPFDALQKARGAMSDLGSLGRAIARGDVAVLPRDFRQVTWDEAKRSLSLSPLERHGIAVDLETLEARRGTTQDSHEARPPGK